MSDDFDVVKHGEIHKPSYLQACWEIKKVLDHAEMNMRKDGYFSLQNVFENLQHLIDNIKKPAHHGLGD